MRNATIGVAAAVGVACLCPGVPARIASASEGAVLSGSALVKMEFIERFTRFVEWPAPVLGDRQPLFILCTAGTSAIVETMPRMAAYDRIKGKPVAFRRVRAGDDLNACHLLFTDVSAHQALSGFLAATQGRPILTITDVPEGASYGALIGFYRQGDRVAFEINRSAADKSGLKISARLLRLARLVGPLK